MSVSIARDQRFHQQYLQKNPAGYCGIGPNGMSCAIGIPGAA